MKTLASRVAFACLAVAGCMLPTGAQQSQGYHPHDTALAVPASLAGPIPIYVKNMLNTPVCGFRLVPDGSPDPGGNWLPSPLSIDNQSMNAVGHIKPGKYVAKTSNCSGKLEDYRTANVDREWQFNVDYDKYREKNPDGISTDKTHGWTNLWSPTPDYMYAHAGPAGGGASAGPAPAQGNCVADGQWSSAQGADCCSTVNHAMFKCNSNETVDVCGPKRDGEGSILPCN